MEIESNTNPHGEAKSDSEKSSPQGGSSPQQESSSPEESSSQAQSSAGEEHSPGDHEGQPQQPRRLKRGWRREWHGKYEYRSPTRLWRFEPHYKKSIALIARASDEDVREVRGKWRFQYKGAWIDYKPHGRAAKLLSESEELPPVQYQDMRRLQAQIRDENRVLEQEMRQRCRQARLELEREVRPEKQGEHQTEDEQRQQERIDQAAVEEQQATRFKRIRSIVGHVWHGIEKALAPDPTPPRIMWPNEFVVAPEDEPLALKSEDFRKRLSLMELEIEDDCHRKLYELEYDLQRYVPSEMISGAPEI